MPTPEPERPAEPDLEPDLETGPEPEVEPDPDPDLQHRPLDLLDPAQEADARRWIEIHAAVQRELFGPAGSAWTLAEIQAFHRSAEKLRVASAAWSNGRMVGALELIMPTADNLAQALVWLSVDPAHRGRGVGTMLVEAAERIGAEHGRSTFVAETEWAAGGHDDGEGFATRHGYALGITMRRSAMTLPPDRDALTGILEAHHDDYALESSVDGIPDDWLADRAVLQQRMSTDAPSGDLAVEEEVWDAERLRANYERAREAGRRVVETVVRHVPSGRLVGFTSVSVSAGEPTLAYQQDTLVLKEHRGHALGLRLKAANALLIAQTLPEVRSVRTWNATSNANMLAVNDALGCAVDGYSREWQKIVAEPARA